MLLDLSDFREENLDNIDLETALKLTMSQNRQRFSESQADSTGRDREFNLDTYKSLYTLYVNSPLGVNFSEVRESFYSGNLRPYFDGENFLLNWGASDKHYSSFVCGLVKKQFAEPSILVDLGAGTGEMVRYISREIEGHYVATDKSEYALKLINLINEREGYNIKTAKMDFAENTINVPKNAFILSTYSMMYMGSNSIQFFSSLLDSNPQGGIFFEPIFSDQNDETLLSKYRRKYIHECNYSADFLNHFEKACSEFGYKIIFHLKNVLAHNLLLPVSAIGWKREEN